MAESQESADTKDVAQGLLILGLLVVLLIVAGWCIFSSDADDTPATMNALEARRFCSWGHLPDGSRTQGCFDMFPSGGDACVDQCLYRLRQEGRIR